MADIQTANEQIVLDLNLSLSAGEWLRRIRKDSRTSVQQGRWFENLFLRVARNEPGFDIEGVWRWADWPDRERLTGLSADDIGVDLVAKHNDGTWIAIQCKCYAPRYRVSKADVQKFLAGSQHEVFGLRWIVATSRWGPTADKIIQRTNIRRIDFRNYHDRIVTDAVERPVRQPWPLQEEAIENVLHGFENHDRGRLIMACGTGKTFTALRIAERFVPDGGTILFLAPTIALVSQARREWLTHTTRRLHSLVVCSDPYAGGKNEQEDIRISELTCPVVSEPEKIAGVLRDGKGTKVVFCTYQSLKQVVEAQRDHSASAFALTIADEAHRTTGVLNRKRSKVDFQLVHDEDQLHTAKRLYMTATPRIYTEKSKRSLAKRGLAVADMSNEDDYGPQFHRLRFKTAVEDRKLADYRVIVLGVNESRVPPGLRTRLDHLADEKWKKNRPTLTDMTRVLGVSLAINGLSEGTDLERPGRLPRTMAFANSILRSKWFTKALMDPQVKALTTRQLHGEDRAWTVKAEHLDASASALERNRALAELRDADKDGVLRVLNNVKLFTEGVDVPSLNAVAFLDPRDSQVDVVQAVGRVMRRAEGKRFGYIVVPVVVKPGMDVADALQNSSEGYHVLGKVLRALQAHDERLHENTAQFVEVLEVKPPVPNVPPDRPRDHPTGDQDDLFPGLDLEAAGEGIYAHVAAASGLGRPGQIVADEIALAVRRAAEIFQSEEVEVEVEVELADALDLPADDASSRKATRTVAALLLCNACLMHRRLRDIPDMKMLPGLGRVGATDDPSSVLMASWSTILELGYVPVFEPALAALKALPNNKAIQVALRGLSECADNLADSLSDLGYDHAGPLYHRILGSAKSDGAFYTNNISALMLARLALDQDFVDWSSSDAVKGLRIIDPACGTGTLLMAALQTIKARMRESGSLGEGNDERLHKALVEDVLCGLDINRHGVQLAACNLTLGAPSVNYSQMNLHTMRHGAQDDGTVKAGSLEILHQNGSQRSLFEMTSRLQGTDTLGTEWEGRSDQGPDFHLRDVDLVIMNPPFTANDKRGRKFASDVKKRMQGREMRIRDELVQRDPRAGLAMEPKSSIRMSFTPLADQLLAKVSNRTLASVLPATACVGTSGERERQFLAERFQVDRVVTSHDPKRVNFSENTSIHECLFVCRRRPDSSNPVAPTEFISLRQMPSTPAEAIEVADAISAGSGEAVGSRFFWPEGRIRAGDWTPVQWYDNSLAEAAWRLDRLDTLDCLGRYHKVGPMGRAAQNSWRRCTGGEASVDSRAVRIFDTISAEVRRSMLGHAEQWVVPGGGKRIHLWEKIRAQSSSLLIAEKFRTTNGRLTAVYSEEPTFGFGWRPVAVQHSNQAKALCSWLNSTPAKLMLLNRRAKTLDYPNWSTAHWKEIRIPKPDSFAWNPLAAAYAKACDLELLPLRQAEECEARRIIDRAAALALDIDEAQIAEWRRKLALEPTISNQRAEP